MPIAIHRTTVTAGKDGDVVQLHISDAPPGDASASFVLQVTVQIASLQSPLLAQVQREAMKQAEDVLQKLSQEAAKDIRWTELDLEPIKKGS